MMKALFAALLVLCLTAPALSQSGPSPDAIAAQIKPLKHKTVILVFDVTESTKHGGVFAEERAASATLIRAGCSPGDRVILLPFGTGYKTVFDTTLTRSADAAALIDQLPTAPAPGHGTDIRWPHHEALRLIARERLCPAVIVLLTDSFNDRPDLTDPNYSKYRDYYTLKGLTVYPKTSENRDYERLLAKLKQSGCLHQYGVGVGIAADGRPIERLPVGPGQGDSDVGTTTETQTVQTNSGPAARASLLPWIIGGLLALLLLGLLLWLLTRRALPVRLRLGAKDLPRDYRLTPGASLALGGSPGLASGTSDLFPLAGVSAPTALIKAERGVLTLVPASSAESGVSPALFHNGLKLQAPTPLRVGDDLRVSVPATATDPEREHRIAVLDPRGPVF